MSNRGGKRENAGRPRGQGKFGEPTVTMRIPESQTTTIKDFLEALQRKRSQAGSGIPGKAQGLQAGVPRDAAIAGADRRPRQAHHD